MSSSTLDVKIYIDDEWSPIERFAAPTGYTQPRIGDKIVRNNEKTKNKPIVYKVVDVYQQICGFESSASKEWYTYIQLIIRITKETNSEDTIYKREAK
jgi:hypothetical protein